VVHVSDRRKLGIVSGFELAEALRSRLVVGVLCVYGLGAGVGSLLFVKALEAVERSIRATLGDALIAHELADQGVRRDALRQLLSYWVDDRSLLEDLVAVDPLALFYGFMALQLVALLVLLVSAGSHARDLSRGAPRFVLTRCDRLTWALGKTLAHAALLLLGLVVSALATAGIGVWLGRFDAASVFWLARAAFRASIYGLAYLGIFTGVTLAVRAPMPALVGCVLALFGLGFGHALSRWEWLDQRVPGLRATAWLFPGEYRQLLWSPSWLVSGAAALALLSIGALAFAGGHWLFRRADA
jgi:hypothetical protein